MEYGAAGGDADGEAAVGGGDVGEEGGVGTAALDFWVVGARGFAVEGWRGCRAGLILTFS